MGTVSAEAAELFAISPQELAGWQSSGPPADRTATIDLLADATVLLERHLKPDRIPSVVRRPAAAIGDRSLIDLAKTREHAELMTAVSRMLDLSRVQP